MAAHGWWAHNIAQNRTGQPADIIAIKKELPVLIDCKDCAGNIFALSRIEANQEAAMIRWEVTVNEHCYFAVRLNTGEIYMIPFVDLYSRERHGKRSITEKEFPKFKTFKEWLEKFE